LTDAPRVEHKHNKKQNPHTEVCRVATFMLAKRPLGDARDRPPPVQPPQLTQSTKPRTIYLMRTLLLIPMLMLVGCHTNPRELPLFDGTTGSPIMWDALLAKTDGADIIVIGEYHGNRDVHRFQRALVNDVMSRREGGALSVEMLERDEQPLVDAWYRGDLDARSFASQTRSTNWSGPGTWRTCYQPVLDAAKEHGATIIASNAPREAVRTARVDGYDAIAVDPAFYTIPPDLTFPGYRERFFELMQENANGEWSDEEMLAVFRAQTMWDATMAASIINALGNGASPIVHLVGCFHSDFDGGTVQELRRLDPTAKVLTIAPVATNDSEFDVENRDRATVLVHVSP
jgi:uncharacterized iron-regulated protein